MRHVDRALFKSVSLALSFSLIATTLLGAFPAVAVAEEKSAGV